MGKFNAKWSGSWPCLCCGEWTIEYNGKVIKLPQDRVTSNMDTYDTYKMWHFEDWVEVWEDYEDGLECTEWIEDNKEWLTEVFKKNYVPVSDENFRNFYHAVNEHDWRHNSCGGCI